MSKIRENVPNPGGELPSPPEGDCRSYAVFTQVTRDRPHTFAGYLEAPDDEMALHFAREHYGRDQPCVSVWVAPREAILATDYERDVVWRLSDQSYRQAKGYLGVRKKWEKFRSKDALTTYLKDDLKEAF